MTMNYLAIFVDSLSDPLHDPTASPGDPGIQQGKDMASIDETRVGKPPDKYFFFVGDQKIETDQPALTGAQIKAKVPNWTAGYGLLLEGHGSEPDILVADDQLISLQKDEGPLRFTAVPPASYGAA